MVRRWDVRSRIVAQNRFSPDSRNRGFVVNLPDRCEAKRYTAPRTSRNGTYHTNSSIENLQLISLPDSVDPLGQHIGVQTKFRSAGTR